MTNSSTSAESLAALVGYEWPRLIGLAAWLWGRGSRFITTDDIARNCPAIESAYAPLAYRLLVRSEALREGAPGQGAQVELANLVSVLIEMGQHIRRLVPSPEQQTGLVWTLPPGLAILHPSPQRSIVDLIRSVIDSAQERLWLVSPYINEAGIEQILEPVISALRRGVRLQILTHYLQDISSYNSQAVRRLYQEATATPGKLELYSVRDLDFDKTYPLFHLKVVTADGKRGYLGSANITGHGLRDYLEIGVSLNAAQVEEIEDLLEVVIQTELVEKLGRTGKGGKDK